MKQPTIRQGGGTDPSFGYGGFFSDKIGSGGKNCAGTDCPSGGQRGRAPRHGSGGRQGPEPTRFRERASPGADGGFIMRKPPATGRELAGPASARNENFLVDTSALSFICPIVLFFLPCE
jgi:hypothetical protein